ncbi:hypothetical protein HMPREF9442_01768 [Paraprevotella xylaniphila YIT 11841]|uniref:Uncharacterized protein n=1 Tax=Paraprevotella xylaniphila YIT 11841 TaxID=762982 RepID=F3QU97_9BACT|nr:hypothetical protein HMPREF9442_01768 [Paraprevotella xylaniphila YIT 11841]
MQLVKSRLWKSAFTLCPFVLLSESSYPYPEVSQNHSSVYNMLYYSVL